MPGEAGANLLRRKRVLQRKGAPRKRKEEKDQRKRRKGNISITKQKAARKALNERNSKLQEQMPASKDDEGEQEQEEAEAPQEIKKSEGAENDELVR